MNVLTDKELLDGQVQTFFLGAGIGACIAIVVCALAYWIQHSDYFTRLSEPAVTPAIVMQTPSQTVARIPTRRDGKRVDCTVTIDQAKNVWSITC